MMQLSSTVLGAACEPPASPNIVSARQRPPIRQAGQALVESMVAISGLAVLWVALNWLAQYQDIALSAIHASRHAAFVVTRVPQAQAPAAATDPFFTGAAHRWVDRHARPLVDVHDPVDHFWGHASGLSPAAQPGAHNANATLLRREWSLEDGGIIYAKVAPNFAPRPETNPRHVAALLNLETFDFAYPTLERSTGILTGAGHAASDTEAQSRVAASQLAWQAAHAASQTAAGETVARGPAADAAWGRTEPSFDWLQPWSGRVPGHLLADYPSTGQREK